MAISLAVAEALAFAVADVAARAGRRASPKVKAVVDGLIDAATPPVGTTLVVPGTQGAFTGVAMIDASTAVLLVGVHHRKVVTAAHTQPTSVSFEPSGCDEFARSYLASEGDDVASE